MARYSNDLVVLDAETAQGGTAVNVGGITNLAHNLSTQLVTPQTGDPYHQVQAISGQMPEIAFTTEAIATLLGEVGLTGMVIDDGVSGDGFIAYMQKHDVAGADARAAAANHMKVTIANGHVLLGALTATPNTNAQLTATAHAISERSSGNYQDPMVVALNATLPADTPANLNEDQMFCAYGCIIGGTFYSTVTNIAVNFNPSFDKPQYAGSLWPALMDVTKMGPVITVTVEQPELYGVGNQITSTGKQVTHANTKIQFIARNVSTGGGFYTAASTQHVVITAQGLAHVGTPYNASGTGVSVCDIIIATVSSYSAGVVAPLIITTGSALSIS